MEIHQTKKRISNVPYTLEIHKSLWRDWMVDYSVEDFLAYGDIYNNPQNYGDPQWASAIANNHYQTHPTTVDRMKYYVSGYLYLRDNANGKIMIMHEEPVVKS